MNRRTSLDAKASRRSRSKSGPEAIGLDERGFGAVRGAECRTIVLLEVVMD